MAEKKELSQKVKAILKKNEFKKGQSGNPNGRPKGAKGFAAMLKKVLETEVIIKDEETGEDVVTTNGEIMVMNLFKTAITPHKKNKDLKATEIIMDRVEGKPIQKQEITGADGDALLVEEITKNMTPKQAAEIYMAEVKNPNISKKAIENKPNKKTVKKKPKKGK